MKGKMNLKNKKFIKKNILLTVVALIEIILIMMMSSAAWIETVSSIKIFTPPADGQGEVGTKGIIETALKQRATVNTTGSDIDLTGYFRPSGGYHLTAASSANGEDVLFPEARGSSGGSYRIATISDKNVNYVSFTFKVTNAVNLAFDQVPTIKINGTAITNNLVRFSIGYAENTIDSIDDSEDHVEDTINSIDDSEDYVEEIIDSIDDSEHTEKNSDEETE